MREKITEEITKVQEIKIPQKIFQSIGLKDAMSEDTFMAGIMYATFTEQHIQEEMPRIIFQAEANPAKENASGTTNLIINKDSKPLGLKPFQQNP